MFGVPLVQGALPCRLCLLFFSSSPHAPLPAAEQWICFFVVGAAAYVFYHYCRKARMRGCGSASGGGCGHHYGLGVYLPLLHIPLIATQPASVRPLLHRPSQAFEEAGWRGMLNFALFGQARNEDPNNNQAGAAGGAAAAGVGPGGQGAAAARPGQRRQRHTVDSVAEALHALPTGEASV